MIGEIRLMSEEKVGCIVGTLDIHDSLASGVQSEMTHLEGNTGDELIGCTFGHERVVLMLTSLGVFCTCFLLDWIPVFIDHGTI